MAALDPNSRVEYRRRVAWPRRIQREWPLLEEILRLGPSRRVLDLGCGTGEHSRFLAAQGFDVTGIDSSESMIEAAQESQLAEPEAARAEGRAGEPPSDAGTLRFLHGDIGDLPRVVADTFGAAICLGNTLPHLRTREALAGLCGGLRARLATAAPVLIQLLNYDRIHAAGERSLPVNIRSGRGGEPEGEPSSELVHLRLMTPNEDGGVGFFPTTLEWSRDRDPAVVVRSSRRVELRGWRREELEECLRTAGFERFERYGSFAAAPFEPLASQDLILVAR